MSDILEDLGRNIRSIRKSRGLTLDQLADKMVDAGADTCTSGMVGAWQRSDRRPLAQNLYFLSVALQCSIDSLFFGEKQQDDLLRLISEIRSLSPRQRQTMLYTASVWDGDQHALLEWIRMYVSIPRRHREDVAGLAINQFKHMVKDKVFTPKLDVDIRMLERQCSKIDR